MYSTAHRARTKVMHIVHKALFVITVRSYPVNLVSSTKLQELQCSFIQIYMFSLLVR